MISDEQLQRAAREAGEALLNSLPSPDQCPQDVTPRFERQMQALLRKNRRTASHRVLGRAAGILLALILAGGVWLSVDAEAREMAANWFRQAYESMFVYRFAGSEQNAADVAYAPTWLPEGTMELDAWQDETGGVILYQDSDGQLCHFSYYVKPSSAPAIVTNTEVTTIKTKKITADYYNAAGLDEQSGFVWIDQESGVLFVISAYFELEDFVRVAESVVTNE